MSLDLKQKNLYKLELPYKIIYMVFAFFTYCNLTFMKPIMSVAVALVLFSGICVALVRLYHWKNYLKMPGLFFAAAFCVSFVISAISNYKYGYSDNFKGLVWMGLHFFTLFACDMKRPANEYKKEFKVISIFFMSVMFVMSFASIVQLCMNYSVEEYNVPPFGITHLAGLVWGRLWGVFTDPNYGSVFAVIAIIFSAYYIRKASKLWVRILLLVNIFIQIFYMAFSDSRTGLVTLFAGAFVYTFLIFERKLKIKEVPKVFMSLLLAFVIGFSSMILVTSTKHVAKNMITEHYEQQEDPELSVPDLEGGREQDIKNDVSNRRFDIWGSGIEIFMEKPVEGVSFYNIQKFALTELPETYLVNNDHGKFSNMHNVLFNILAGQGLIGTIIFLAFLLYAFIFIFKRIFKQQDDENYEYLSLLSACVIASFASSMFLTDVLYVNSPTSIFFWMFLGFIFHNLKQSEMIEKQQQRNE